MGLRREVRYAVKDLRFIKDNSSPLREPDFILFIINNTQFRDILIYYAPCPFYLTLLNFQLFWNSYKMFTLVQAGYELLIDAFNAEALGSPITVKQQ